MSANIIDGKKTAKDIRAQLAIEVEELKKRNIVPGIALILVGDDSASKLYVRSKGKVTEEIGGYVETHHFPENSTREEILSLIEKLNEDKKIHGVLVQLPLPEHLEPYEKEIINAILPEKDVDAFHPVNLGNLMSGDDCYWGCTAYGCLRLLENTGVDFQGKHAVIIGSTIEVAKPLSVLLLERGCVVTVVPPETSNLKEFTKLGDILVLELANPRSITGDMVKPGAIVIDTGANWIDGKSVGDAEFESVSQVASWISPVPGGVGPMIIAMLMYNLVEAAKKLC